MGVLQNKKNRATYTAVSVHPWLQDRIGSNRREKGKGRATLRIKSNQHRRLELLLLLSVIVLPCMDSSAVVAAAACPWAEWKKMLLPLLVLVLRP